MFTGTLIQDLMTTVERAEQSAQQKRIIDEMELRRMFALQVPAMRVSAMRIEPVNTQAYAGAA